MQTAIANAGEIDERKVDAQQARRVLDRLVGYKASPVLWKTVKKGISAGRVQTVALRLLVEREREIKAFKPVEYWTVEALLEKEGQEFIAKLHHIDSKKRRFRTRKPRSKILADLETLKTFGVTEVKRRERRKNRCAAVHDEHASAGSREEARLRLEAHDAPRAGSVRRHRARARRRGRSHHVHAHRFHSRLGDVSAQQARDYVQTAVRQGVQSLRRCSCTAMESRRTRRMRTKQFVRQIPRVVRSTSQRYLKPDQFKLYRADLAAIHRVADGAGTFRYDDCRLRSRETTRSVRFRICSARPAA